MKRTDEIQYNGELTGTVDETHDRKRLGLTCSPIQQMWQVGSGTEAAAPDDLANGNG